MAAPCDFQLPLVAGDLLRGGGAGRYVVQDVLSGRELPPAVAAVRARCKGRPTENPLPHIPGKANPRGASAPSECFSQLTGGLREQGRRALPGLGCRGQPYSWQDVSSNLW
uniref:Uncharacterized protein n=1 Tax=Cairina moschata TaxID=8855 RepID=A0A8C3CL67_CAIMO